MPEFSENLIAANYAVAFMDLLGQRQAYEGESLVPTEDVALAEFYSTLKKTLGPIVNLQVASEGFVEAARGPASSFRARFVGRNPVWYNA